MKHFNPPANNVVKFYRDENYKDIPIPLKSTKEAAGYDICAADDYVIKPGERLLISTGLFLIIPWGYEGQVRPRSGIAIKSGVTVINSPGTIDSDYRGELFVPLINHGDSDFNIKKGDRIAQLVICAVPNVSFEEISKDVFDNYTTIRGDNGFGSTGI